VRNFSFLICPTANRESILKKGFPGWGINTALKSKLRLNPKKTT
jgi:hypothetical protein